MFIDPVSAGVAGVSTILGFFQQSAADEARQQDYLNQSAYGNANAQFSRWQAGMNQKVNTLNGQYNYWGQTVQYNQNLAYTSQLRNYELAKELAQADRVAQARVGAGANYILKSEAISQQLQERGMQEAVALQQYNYRALQSSAAYQAMAQEGQSTDRYVANFARQAGDYATIMKINQGLQQRQYRREQVAAITQYLNEYNSQQFYEPTPYVDPIAPFPPLPSLVMPPPPSMVGGAPASSGALGVGTQLLGGFNTYVGTYQAIKNLG
jgi:hypothetical protein